MGDSSTVYKLHVRALFRYRGHRINGAHANSQHFKLFVRCSVEPAQRRGIRAEAPFAIILAQCCAMLAQRLETRSPLRSVPAPFDL